MSSPETVLLVTVKKVESEAVLETFKQTTGQPSKAFTLKSRSYFELGEISGLRLFLSLSEMGSGGRGGSQESVRKAIDGLNPDAVIMLGIAFGMNEKKQAIGDVLISQRLWLYDLQRRGKQIIPRGDKPHASPELINQCQAASLLWNDAKVHFGILLSGEKLIDDIDYRNQLKKLEVEAIGGEMEGAGLYVACENKRKPWIVVKAICDWGDGNKHNPEKKKHQTLAALNAAAFVLKVLAIPRTTNKNDSSIAAATGMPRESADGFSSKSIQECADTLLNFAYYQTEGFTVTHIHLTYLQAYHTWINFDEKNMSITDRVMSLLPKKVDADGFQQLDEDMIQLALDECVLLGYLESRQTGIGIRYDITPKGRARFSRLLVDGRDQE